MVELEKIQAFFKKDYFAAENGMQIEKAEPGDAICVMPIEKRHLNAGGTVQGGAIFTLADFAFAVAANCGGTLVVSLDNHISFIAPPRGKMLFAHAYERSSTTRIRFYDVDVTDEKGKLIAKMDVTGYQKSGTIKF